MNCKIFEIMKRIIASKVRVIRKISWTEKKLCTLEAIEGKINMITLTNETRGVTTTSPKRSSMNSMTNIAGRTNRHEGKYTPICQSAITTKKTTTKTIRKVDKVSIPHANMAIQAIEKMRDRIAVLRSIASLSSSVYFSQDGGVNLNLKGNLAQPSNLSRM